MAPAPDADSALVLSATAAGQKHQVVVAHRRVLADKALRACGLVRPGSDQTILASKGANGCDADDGRISQMQEVLRTRGVKQRLADDFDLAIGTGEDVKEDETEPEFLHRAIQALQKADVQDVIKVFDRVEKRNRQAANKDAAFAAQQNRCRQKIASNEALEQEEDAEFGTEHKGSPEEFEEELQDWSKFGGESDFTAWCSAGISKPCGPGDDILGEDVDSIKSALEYFITNSKSGSPEMPLALDAASIKVQLADWTPAVVHSAFRRLSLAKHPDKESGSPEAFQELVAHAKVLAEVSARFHHHKSSSSGGTSRRADKKQSATAAARSAPKPAICAEVPEHLKTAISYFGFSEDDFRGGSSAELKKLKLVLSATKERKEKEIHREKDTSKLIEVLREYTVEKAAEEEGEDAPAPALEDRDPKKLKSLCISLCRRHYQALFAHVLKLK